MSIRKERFCDFMAEEKEDELARKCTQAAIGKCFICKRDYCREHKDTSYNSGVTLEITGFKQRFVKRLPCCSEWISDPLPYNPRESALIRFDRLWGLIERSIRAEIKEARIKAEEKKKRRAKNKVQSSLENIKEDRV